MRSMLSTSSVTCSRMISETFRDKFMLAPADIGLTRPPDRIAVLIERDFIALRSAGALHSQITDTTCRSEASVSLVFDYTIILPHRSPAYNIALVLIAVNCSSEFVNVALRLEPTAIFGVPIALAILFY